MCLKFVVSLVLDIHRLRRRFTDSGAYILLNWCSEWILGWIEYLLLYWMYVHLKFYLVASRKKMLERAPSRANRFEPSSGISSLTHPKKKQHPFPAQSFRNHSFTACQDLVRIPFALASRLDWLNIHYGFHELIGNPLFPLHHGHIQHLYLLLCLILYRHVACFNISDIHPSLPCDCRDQGRRNLHAKRGNWSTSPILVLL